MTRARIGNEATDESVRAAMQPYAMRIDNRCFRRPKSTGTPP